MRKKNYTVLPPDNDPKVLGIFTKDKAFYRTFFPLLLVITLQQLAALAVNMADNIMLGRYTELALSGATLVNQIQFTLMQIAAGIGMGIVALSSQYWGQGRTEPIKKIINIGVKSALVIGILEILILVKSRDELLDLYGAKVVEILLKKALGCIEHLVSSLGAPRYNAVGEREDTGYLNSAHHTRHSSFHEECFCFKAFLLIAFLFINGISYYRKKRVYCKYHKTEPLRIILNQEVYHGIEPDENCTAYYTYPQKHIAFCKNSFFVIFTHWI